MPGCPAPWATGGQVLAVPGGVLGQAGAYVMMAVAIRRGWVSVMSQSDPVVAKIECYGTRIARAVR